MDLKQLQYFVAVYEEGGFSKAALRLNSTQPGISTHIAVLEAALGVQLFERHARGIRPTLAGTRLYARAIPILRELNSARQEIEDLAGTLTGRLAAGIPPTLSKAVLAPVLSRYTAEFPDVDIRVVEAYSNTLAALLATRELDFALVTQVPDQPSLRFERIFQDRFVLVSGKKLGLQPGAPIHLDAKPSFKVVIPSLRNGLHRILDEPLQTGRISALRTIEIDGLAGALEFVAMTDWVALLPAATANSSAKSEAITVNPIAGPPIRVEYFIAHVASEPLSPSCQEFVKILGAELARISEAFG